MDSLVSPVMYLTLTLLAVFTLFYSSIAGRVERSWISPAMVFTAFGLIAGPSVLGWLELSVEGEVVRLLAEMTLAIVLFVDAAHGDIPVIRSCFGVLGRLLLISLPLTILAGFGIGTALFAQLSPIEIALLAVMLAPTDAALGKPVISNKSLPAQVRESLNFESGLNDGICVPILLFFLHLARMGGSEEPGPGSMGGLMLKEVGIGAGVGAGLALVSGLVLRAAWARGFMTDLWSRVTVAALAIACFAITQWLGGSGLIASFVGGLVFAVLVKKEKHELLHSGEVFGETFTLVTWVIFGAAVLGPLFSDVTPAIVLYAVLSITLVRMLPVWLSLTGTGLDTRTKLFIAWFGPRGLASVVFAVMVYQADLPGGRTISAVVGLTVLFSVIAHGMTANPLGAAYARRIEDGERA